MNIPLLQLIAAIFLLGVVFFLAAGVFMFGARMGRRTAQRLHRGDALLPEPSAPVENVTAAASAAVLGRDAEQALPPKQTAPVPASPDAQDTRTLVPPPPP